MSTQENLVLNTEANANSNNGSNDEGYSSSSPPATPITQPVYLTLSPTLLISITSHTYAPPLQPTPDLKYDLRELPGPDNYTRGKYDGRSKHLREWLSKENGYAELLEKVEQDIMAKGRELEAEVEVVPAPEVTADAKETGEKPNTEEVEKKEEATEGAEQKAVAEKQETSEEVEKTAVEGEEEAQDPEQSEDPAAVEPSDAGDLDKADEPQVPVKPPKVLRVGVCCELGRHRSVAFIEELARRQWPAEWAVEVVHRDVAKGWGQRKGKGNRRDKGGRRKSLKGGVIDDNDD
jgi:hypothetical protein